MSQNTGHIPLPSDVTMQPYQTCDILKSPDQITEATRDFVVTFDPRVNQEPSSEMSLLQALTRIIERLFDRDAPDPIIVQNMKSEMFVSISVLCGHPYIQSLTTDAELVVKAACASEKVVVDVENYIIKPMYKIERKTVILREMPPEADEQFIRGLFNTSGPHIKAINKVIDNIWFVSFESEPKMLEAFFEVKKNKINNRPIQVRVKSENLLRATQYPGADAIHAFHNYRYWPSHPVYPAQVPYFCPDYNHAADGHPTPCALPHAYFPASQFNLPRKTHLLQAKKKNSQSGGNQTTQNTVKRSLSTSELSGNPSKPNPGNHSKGNFGPSNRFPRRKNINSTHKLNANHNNSGRNRIRPDAKKDSQKTNTSSQNNDRLIALSLAPSNFPPLASCRESKTPSVSQQPLHKSSLTEQTKIANVPNPADVLPNHDNNTSLDSLVSNLQIQPKQVSPKHHPSQQSTCTQNTTSTTISSESSSARNHQLPPPATSQSQNKSSESASNASQHFTASPPCPQSSSNLQSQHLRNSTRPNLPIQSWAELLRSSVNDTTNLDNISSN
ncbi:la-related protein 4-like [Schistocerca gregaria]|uniref:la-related protein 4-like n=1 Tax=Schistocerca gregaria TaxID=7010 RepID=UPI00211E9F5F|nr:la-related protein 4-like [Schistocerca gregaria]